MDRTLVRRDAPRLREYPDGPGPGDSGSRSKASDSLHYDKLDLAAKHIRLMRLDLSPRQDEVRASLDTYLLDDRPPFVALSYVWGQEPPSRGRFYQWKRPRATSHVFYLNGRLFQIRNNLWSALKTIKQLAVSGALHDKFASRASAKAQKSWQDKDRPPPNLRRYHIWVDAICINQQDLQERGHQVNMMFEIYRKDDFVVSWLALMAFMQERPSQN